MTLWRDHLNEMLATDKEFRHEWERTAGLRSAILDTVRLRIVQGITQAQLAERMGRKQPSIGRFEAGNSNPTLGFLQDVAEALGARLVVRLEPSEAASQVKVEEAEPQKATARSRKRRSGAAA